MAFDQHRLERCTKILAICYPDRFDRIDRGDDLRWTDRQSRHAQDPREMHDVFREALSAQGKRYGSHPTPSSTASFFAWVMSRVATSGVIAPISS